MYAADSHVRRCAVIVFIINLVQTLARQVLSVAVDGETSDLAGNACTVNFTALVMYCFYAGALPVVQSRRPGGGARGRPPPPALLHTPPLYLRYPFCRH